VTIENPVIDITDIGTSEAHVTCCRYEKFMCKAPYHPEAAAPQDTPEEECCKPCMKVVKDMQCRGHSHCPFDLSPKIRCPK